MSKLKQYFAVILCLAFLFGPVADAQALTSAVGTSTLTYSQGETLTVSGVPTSLTFDPVTATTQVLNITVTWQLAPTRVRVALNLFFTNPAIAMSDGAGHNISASSIGANKNGSGFSGCGTAPDSLLAGIIPANGACNVGSSVNITAANVSSTLTDQYQLKILNTGSLASSTYTGVISYVAGAQ